MGNNNTAETARTIKRTVLIVEDNEINREMLKEILADSYNIIEAEDGLEGLEKLQENHRILSLILLDVQMPRMNGYEFLEQSQKDPQLSLVPVIVTTGSTVSEDEERCLALGASDFVTKPYNPNIILRRIEAIIRLRESITTLQAVEYDKLTGIYNTAAFYHHAQSSLQFFTDVDYSMIMLNLEDFSILNERYGETKCNDLLAHIGKVLSGYTDRGFLCGRHNNDRFVIMTEVSDISCDDIIEQLDQKVLESAPIKTFTTKYAVYHNIDHSLPINVICDRLASAVNTIKHQFNQQTVTYTNSMSEKAMRLHVIEGCMEEALEKEQFQVWYQPKHDPATGKLCGAEALARWIHPQYGFMSPGDFIPLFENNGFISALDLYIWRKVCEDLRSWQEQGIPLIPVSVNASRRDFFDDDYLNKVEAPQIQNNVDKLYLHLEITESLCNDDDLILERIRTVHDSGFCIELDDFGAGYSSLGMLKDIPMDILKLDMSFSRAIEKQKEIIQMIISLAHSLGLKVVAEGVENDMQHNSLRDMGCDYIQGYYYSKPLPSDKFREYLKQHTENN